MKALAQMCVYLWA